MFDAKMFATLATLLAALCSPGCSPGHGSDGPAGGGEGEGEGGEGEGEGGEGEGEGGEGEGEGAPADEIGVGTDTPFDESEGTGVEIRPDGAITIGGRGVAITHTLIWIANSTQGTVSKLDTRTHEELGRYRTGSDYMDPSRTSVNRDGHVVVANRGFSSATRILASDCPDQNGDGVVRTSTGGADILDWGQDECVVWNTPVGNADAGARGTVVEERVGLDGVIEEFAWVGAYAEMTMWEIRTATGEHTGRIINIAPVMPYGAALGPGGKLWATGGSDLAEIDTTTGQVTQHPVPGGRSTYGITVDGNGDVWTGGSIQRYRPSTDTWDWPEIAGGGGLFGMLTQAGGVAADAEGIVWAGLGLMSSGILRIDPTTMTSQRIETGGNEHGVAVDFDGMIWGVDFVGTAATIVDPVTLASERLRPPFVGAYTYSDMTGFQTANATHTYGRYRHLFEGCANGETQWTVLSWDADTPGASRVTFTGHTSDDPAETAFAPGVALASAPLDDSPTNIDEKFLLAGVQAGRYLLVDVGLFSDDAVSMPAVFSFGVDYTCPGSLE